MAEFDFTQEDLDQMVLTALERRRQRLAGGLAQDGALPLGGGQSTRDRLLEALQRRSLRRRPARRDNGGTLPL